MKFMHVSDLHLDRAFEGLHHISPFLEEQIKGNAQAVLQNILKVATEEHVELLFIVGDTFHQAHISYEMQQLWVQFLQACLEAEIQACVLFGNHDYYDPARYWLPWPKEVITWTSEEVETKYLELASGEMLALSGFSYTHPHIQVEKALEYPWRDSSIDYHIGLYHGQQGQGSYAPFNLETLKSRQYDYWALGHIHQYQSLAPNIVYCGTIQGKTKKEGDKGRAIIGELTKDYCHLQPLLLAPLHYQSITTKVEQQTIDTLIQEVKKALPYQAPTVVDWTLCRDTGTSDTLWEELENKDFREYVYKGIATGDTLFISEIHYQNAQATNSALKEELVARLQEIYSEEEVFSAVGQAIFQDEQLKPYQKNLLAERAAIVTAALEELGEDLAQEYDH